MIQMTKNQKDQLFIMINSLIYFMLAYFSVVTFTNLFSMLLGVANGCDGTLYYYGFILNPVHGSWSKDLVFQVFMLGTSVSLATGILFERLYKQKRKHSSPQKMYFLWFFILSFTWFFGNVIVGGLANFGIGAAFRSFSIPLIIRIVFSVGAVVTLLLIGYYSRFHVLISANIYFTHIRISGFRRFLMFQILVPAIIGNILIFLSKIPHHAEFFYLDSLVVLSVFLFIAGLYLNPSSLQSINFKPHNKTTEILVVPLAIMFLVIIILRIGLSSGLTL